ncbi:hypothetical protein E1301_Tti010999 [Triplophysa tibetana]|uniref:Uncharacterized protein n=1 Tax=Triplophysa tibetana TaxID=1572043 RepID=A0A5A9MZB1_9TELE|nr:hypothetical protein E1301_Tti010999 [Triplophysa tibetana]
MLRVENVYSLLRTDVKPRDKRAKKPGWLRCVSDLLPAHSIKSSRSCKEVLHEMSNHTTSHRLLSLSAEFPLHGLESFSQQVSDPYSDPFDSFTVHPYYIIVMWLLAVVRRASEVVLFCVFNGFGFIHLRFDECLMFPLLYVGAVCRHCHVIAEWQLFRHDLKKNSKMLRILLLFLILQCADREDEEPDMEGDWTMVIIIAAASLVAVAVVAFGGTILFRRYLRSQEQGNQFCRVAERGDMRERGLCDTCLHKVRLKILFYRSPFRSFSLLRLNSSAGLRVTSGECGHFKHPTLGFIRHANCKRIHHGGKLERAYLKRARVFKQLDYVITKSSIHTASEPCDECPSIQNQSQA